MASAAWLEQFDHRIADAMVKSNDDVPVGLSSLLGITFDELTPGHLRASLEVRAELLSPAGNLHGGTIAALVDHVLGCVLYPHMSSGQWAATTEFKINYLKPVINGRVVADASIVNMTKRTAVVRIEVENAERPVAVAQGTVMIMEPKPSPGTTS